MLRKPGPDPAQESGQQTGKARAVNAAACSEQPNSYLVNDGGAQRRELRAHDFFSG
jgi:hypothetical protein